MSKFFSIAKSSIPTEVLVLYTKALLCRMIRLGFLKDVCEISDTFGIKYTLDDKPEETNE